MGYGAFPAWMMPVLWKAKQPYNVNVAANVAALASLQDMDYLAANVAALRAERSRLYAGLQNVPYLQPYPSESNFILCKVLDRPGIELKEALAKEGILVRYYNTTRLKGYIRISIGRSPETDKVLEVLGKLGTAGA